MPRAGTKSPDPTGDVRRLTAAVKKAGLSIYRLEITHPNGAKYCFDVGGEGDKIVSASELDQWLVSKHAGDAQEH